MFFEVTSEMYIVSRQQKHFPNLRKQNVSVTSLQVFIIKVFKKPMQYGQFFKTMWRSIRYAVLVDSEIKFFSFFVAINLTCKSKNISYLISRVVGKFWQLLRLE